jgi:hypothetical protein
MHRDARQQDRNVRMTLSLLRRLLSAAASDDPAVFGPFLGRQAIYIAQKTVTDYCRVKTGRAEREMFEDAEFAAAMRHCRWQVYFATTADVAAMAEAWLRPAAPDSTRLAERLAALLATAIEAEPAPERERDAARAAADAILPHLHRMQSAPPQPANTLPLLAEAPLFATLPVHPEQRAGEAGAIRGALRFNVLTTQQEMERRFLRERLAARLGG